MLIDYAKIGRSIDFYEKKGFKRIEAPWWVPEQIMLMTAPKDRDSATLLYKLEKNKKCLVASAEQGFLYMANQGMLAPGSYQAAGPCFRDEVQGPGRRKFFFKNELIVTDNTTTETVDKIVETVLQFMKTEAAENDLLQVVKTNEGYDINYDGLEVGSYGIRENEILRWVYATGIAEPRFSYAIVRSRHLRKASQ